MLDINVDHDDEIEGRRRIVNTISLLLPAKEYRLDCSWTTERPLPAIEEFACKLLLLLGDLSPYELGQYFGLSSLERDGLVDSLLKKRLVDLNNDGHIQPSSILQVKSRSDGGVPTLTQFETHEESATFDLLTLQLLPRRSYQGTRYGLPEVPPPDGFNEISIDRISEAFSSQYRAHLDFTRPREAANHKTRLYKIGNCRQERTLQVPIDIHVSMEVGADGELRVYRDAFEKLGEARHRLLTNDLEARVTDYLAGLKVNSDGLSFEEFCAVVDDDVLNRYSCGGEFEFARWIRDRDEKKTGYGSPTTTALLGPVYLQKNRITITKRLDEALKALASSVDYAPKAYWFPAAVPLWAASGNDLSTFTNSLQKSLNPRADEAGKLVTFFNVGYSSQRNQVKKMFGARLPNAISLSGKVPMDRLELLVIPGHLAIAQFHIQPSEASAVTIPIGHVTTDPDRIARISALLQLRVQDAQSIEVLWSGKSTEIQDLVDTEWLGLALEEDPNHQTTKRNRAQTIRLKKQGRMKN